MPQNTITVKRHKGELSAKETDEVVGVVADLIVNFLKRQQYDYRSDGEGRGRSHEQRTDGSPRGPGSLHGGA